MFLVLDIKCHFTIGESNLCKILSTFQNVMSTTAEANLESINQIYIMTRKKTLMDLFELVDTVFSKSIM